MAIERIKQAGSNHPWNNLMRLLEDEDLWVAAYTKLTPNPGLRYEAGVGGTIDGTSLKTLKALQRAVLERRFEWGTTQRVLGLRKEGQRPLEIPELQDRIVQEVLRRILDAIYEPQFVNQSHGFRPKRSQHSCIKYIRAWFPGTVWYIEGAQQCFDTIDHDSLMAILQKSIADKRFLTLISKGLKSRALSPKGNEKNGVGLRAEVRNEYRNGRDRLTITELGVPQGGIVSPLLSNIYLHELDKFLIRLQIIIHKGDQRERQSKEYHRLTSQIFARREKKKSSTLRFRFFLPKMRAQLHSKDSQDPGYRRLQFVRYADDFLVGIIGPKHLALRVKELIARFLKHKLKLELSLEKTLISHCSKRIPFLGFQICTSRKSLGAQSLRTMVGKAQLKTRTIRQRIPATFVRIYADVNRVIQTLAQKGFCKPGGEPKPNWMLALHPPQSVSVARAASIIRGLDSYYKVSDDRVSFTHRVMWLIRSSLAKTFAAKFKLRTQAQVFARAGPDLSRPIKSGSRGKTAIGLTDQIVLRETHAIQTEGGGTTPRPEAEGDLVEKMPRIPFTQDERVPAPDQSHSYSGSITNEPRCVLLNKALKGPFP
jgi:retron-type reverse transcriptase